MSDWPFRTTREAFFAVRTNAKGELPESLPLVEAGAALDRKDAFELTEVDHEVRAKHWNQLAGYFIIDRDGVIRWTHVEAEHGVADYGKSPSNEEILAVARALVQ